MYFKREFPRRILRVRELCDLSQKALAAKSGIALSTLNELEGGFAGDLRVSTLLRLSATLGVTPNWLLGFEPEDSLPQCRALRAPYSPVYEARCVKAYVRNPELPCQGACFRCREPEARTFLKLP